MVRPDPRCEGAARRQRALGLHAEAVTIRYVYPNESRIMVEFQSKRRKTFDVDNPVLLRDLERTLSKPGSLPSPATLTARTRAELHAGRFTVWLPGWEVYVGARQSVARGRPARAMRVRKDAQTRPPRRRGDDVQPQLPGV